MEQFVQQTLLYDFYGELLTEHQRRIYEDVVLNDYSLSEVAADLGISRQGVHDNVKRCNKILSDYEEKLHLVEKFVNIKEKSTGFTVLRKIAKASARKNWFRGGTHFPEILEEL
ncbi:MAG: YlxM family DNA-binding protein [Blautia wexlerae]